MSYVISANDEEFTVPVSIRGGVLHAAIRAVDQATYRALALEAGILVVDDDGRLRDAPGVTTCEIGAVTLRAAELDVDGLVIRAADIDERWHVNFWLSPALVARGVWEGWALQWSIAGRALLPAEINKVEDGAVLDGIELIDPDSVASPVNVLLLVVRHEFVGLHSSGRRRRRDGRRPRRRGAAAL